MDDLDLPVYGARAIALVLNLRRKNGEPNERRAFYMLEKGYVEADKIGETWTSTPRRLLKRHLATT